jgi:hypothetical protein
MKNKSICVILCLLLCGIHVQAQQKTFTREYAYQAGEDDSRNSARSDQGKRGCSRRLGSLFLEGGEA